MMEAHPDHDGNDDDVVCDSVGGTKAIVSPVYLESFSHDGGGHTVQGSVDDATVLTNEIGAIMENFEKVMNNMLEDDSEVQLIKEDKVVEAVKHPSISAKVSSER
uniref:Uncharacterized protein n=1 Tax=Tanacetum cinerariifolium TaxID=118510 RepID=A0A699I954_TANCI|nr:hypothetical protein [Tanacetum cinerariifolium]